MARTRNRGGKSGGEGPSQCQPSHQSRQRDEGPNSEHPEHSVHSIHFVHSVHPVHFHAQPDLRESLNRSRAHITVGSREVNTIEATRLVAKNARRQACLYDLEALQLQHEETGRRLEKMEAQIARDREQRPEFPTHFVQNEAQSSRRSRQRSLAPEEERRSRRTRRRRPSSHQERRNECRRSGQGSVFTQL